MKCHIDWKCFVHFLHRTTPKQMFNFPLLIPGWASLRKNPSLSRHPKSISLSPQQLPQVTLHKTWRQFVLDLVTYFSSIVQPATSDHFQTWVCRWPLTWVALRNTLWCLQSKSRGGWYVHSVSTSKRIPSLNGPNSYSDYNRTIFKGARVCMNLNRIKLLYFPFGKQRYTSTRIPAKSQIPISLIFTSLNWYFLSGRAGNHVNICGVQHGCISAHP